ncbi:SRPBCC family protein [Chryseobacterium rhizosphaerae]|uniref:SRPBCC family protein n=1 Tax=Chryseobacterium rhizosphaerae TaxID=395937 RepID=UPI0023593F90|nr:SRPBCC family protein [Chryseobacterium rhizosphaerae]MDC8098859.1 SRPBCC family protein [Chryseobacterium rhizosphaerae]
MKTLLKIIGIIILLIAVYAIIAMLAFSKDYHFEKSVVIKAPKEKVWSHVGSLKEYNVWDPFSKADKNIVITYSGDGDKIGDSYHWKGDKNVGEGEQAIAEIVPNEKMVTKLHFIQPFEGNAKGTFVLTPEGNGTKVTWMIDNELNTMMKIMKPMMDNNMDKMFGQGLDGLKQISEK